MKIVIIGAEAAGASAAAKARRLAPDAQIIVYERTDIVSFGACGLPYYVGDSFDDPAFMISRTVAEFRASGIDIRNGWEVTGVQAADKTLSVSNPITGETATESYDQLLIATGAGAVVPPIRNVQLENVFTLKNMGDGIAVKKAAQQDEIRDVVIIGAGFIGMETAEAMVRMGKQVRIIQLEGRVMKDAFDREVTALMEEELAAAGIAVHVSECVRALRGDGRVNGVVTDRGEYAADMVIIAAGVRPATAFLENTGIQRLDNGAIVIDAYGRTSLPDVYAAGDCATVFHRIKQKPAYIPLATTANKIGKIVGENLAGGSAVFTGTLGTAAVRIMEFEAGRTGLTEEEAAAAGLSFKAVFVKDKNHSNYLPGQSAIYVKLIYDAVSRRLLGGQVAGRYGAALRANVLAAAVWNGMTVEQLGALDLFYAPPFSRPWDVLNIAANAAK